jgi:hypothetical protein
MEFNPSFSNQAAAYHRDVALTRQEEQSSPVPSKEEFISMVRETTLYLLNDQPVNQRPEGNTIYPALQEKAWRIAALIEDSTMSECFHLHTEQTPYGECDYTLALSMLSAHTDFSGRPVGHSRETLLVIANYTEHKLVFTQHLMLIEAYKKTSNHARGEKELNSMHERTGAR